MGPRARQLLTTVAVLLGLTSSAMLLSAFHGDVVGIFTSRDRRFVLMLLAVAAVVSALTSRVAGFLIGVVALVIMVSQSYPPGQVDVVALRWAAVLLALFDLGLGGQIWLDRENY